MHACYMTSSVVGNIRGNPSPALSSRKAEKVGPSKSRRPKGMGNFCVGERNHFYKQ